MRNLSSFLSIVFLVSGSLACNKFNPDNGSSGASVQGSSSAAQSGQISGTYINADSTERIDFSTSELLTLTNLDSKGQIVGAHPSKFKVQWSSKTQGKLFAVRFVDEGAPEACGTLSASADLRQIKVQNCPSFPSAAYNRVDDVKECSGSSTVEMKDCASKRLAVADQKMNAVYQKLLQKTRSADANYPAGVTDIPPKHEEKLVDSELAWIKLRNTNCLLDATRAFGGTAYGLLETECLIKETNARIQFLEEQLRLRSL